MFQPRKTIPKVGLGALVLALTGGELFITLPQITNGPQVFRFQRGGGVASGARQRSNPYRGYQPQGAGGGQLDPRLFGRWRRTESMVSGGASFVSDEHLVVRRDGTYTLSSREAAGRTASVSAVVGGGGGTTGRWRVRGKTVEISEGGPFQHYARYAVDGNNLMFIFNDGSKQLWSR